MILFTRQYGQPQLPSLTSFLRTSPQQLGQNMITIWELIDGASLFHLPTDIVRTYAQSGTQQAPEVDQAYLWVLTNLPEIAAGSEISVQYLQDSLNREAALTRMEKAGQDLAQAMVDDMYLIRAGLYAVRVEVDQTVADRLANTTLPPGQHWSLSASWSTVAKAEATAPGRAAATRLHGKQLQGQVQPGLDLAAASKQDLQDIQLLLDYAHKKPAKKASSPATSAHAHTKKTPKTQKTH